LPIWCRSGSRHRCSTSQGEKWKYNQSGINAAGRIVEVVSGISFDTFLQQRLFDPLGMKDTTFYPTEGAARAARHRLPEGQGDRCVAAGSTTR
jgi:CubicO group peptidase (beta-lactamase class C family)